MEARWQNHFSKLRHSEHACPELIEEFRNPTLPELSKPPSLRRRNDCGNLQHHHPKQPPRMSPRV